MSIGLLATLNPYLLPVWLIWAGVAVALAGFTLAGRSRSLFEPRLEPTDVVIRLGPAAVLMYVAFVLVATVLTQQSARAGFSPEDAGQVAIRAFVSPLAGAILGFILIRSKTYREMVGISVDRVAGGVWWGLLGICIALPLVWWTLEATQSIWTWVGFKHPEKHRLLNFMDQPTAPWIKVGIVCAAVVVTPVFEELLFRGLVQTSFRRISGRAWVGILVASTLFALVHEPWTSPPIFVLSVGLGMVYHFSGSLWAAITMHAAFNAFSIATNQAN